MSNASMFAAGLGGGLAYWALTKSPATAPPPSKSEPRAQDTAPAKAVTGPATPTVRNCVVRIDPSGLIADGARVDLPEAVRRCTAAGRVALTVAPDAPASMCAQLVAALRPDGTSIRNARRPARETPNQAEVFTTFTLVVFPEGVWGKSKRVRYFRAEPATTWDDARDRLRAANLIDPDAVSPNLAGAWRLVTDPARFRADLAESLPTGPRDAARVARRTQRYTREGRTILRDGTPIVHVDRIDLGDQRYAISPHDADRLTHRMVHLLNKHGAR